MKDKNNVAEIKLEILKLNQKFLEAGLAPNELQLIYCNEPSAYPYLKLFTCLTIATVLLSVFYELDVSTLVINYALGVRCVIPNNYFVWEATRPISDCDFCLNVTEPILLDNVTREQFQPFAYSSKPIVVKRAFLHWPALEHFDFEFFKTLYSHVQDSYGSADEECQFLHFQSDFISLSDVFGMSEGRAKMEPGFKPWYVGWANCRQEVVKEMRKYYPLPHFLPEDCEVSNKEYVFMGYDAGATMHAQLKGSKTWYLKPSPECEDVCNSVTFVVEPGDGVLVDTRVWYHGTTITPGEFSLSIQSEYG